VNTTNPLNPGQNEAANYHNGPLLVVAGAGAGKTKTVAERIRRLIESGVPASRIIAITFTNKAAKELRERVNNPGVFASTFHSLGVHILRDHAQAIGLNRHFTIFDKDDAVREVKDILVEKGLDPKQIEPRRVLGAISKAKGNGHNRVDYGQQAQPSFFNDTVFNVWEAYDQRLRDQKALDFDDLLLKTAELLESRAEVLNHYRERWHYLHIDEYQDTNAIQYRLAKLLTGDRQNICVVGDVDQSIYSWRGADFRNLLRFEQDYPKAKVVLLEENYRSTKTILAAANEVIKKNRERHDKNLFTNNQEGEMIGLMIGLDEKEEAQLVAESAARHIRSGTKAGDIAVLYRANFQSRVIEEAFLRADVPYQVLGTKFFERQEIKDVLAYIRAALNPDDIVSTKRVINLPPRGLGKVTLAKIFSGQEDGLANSIKIKLDGFRANLSTIRKAAKIEKPSQLIKTVIEQSGLGAMWRSGASDDLERLENAKELATLALRYDELPDNTGIEKLLDDAALASDQDSLDEKDQKRDGVRLMTVHAAKGLEFNYVYVVGMEQNLFPHQGFDRDEERDSEEERRLFYVAITRARQKLYLSYAQMRTIYGSRQLTLPSQFIGEIPSYLIEAENDPLSFVDF
jgi:DNA helicase-2/ATP-dependent DNA helicase PcrA